MLWFWIQFYSTLNINVYFLAVPGLITDDDTTSGDQESRPGGGAQAAMTGVEQNDDLDIIKQFCSSFQN